MLTTTLLLAALSIPVEAGQNPYDIALSYCSDRGGLAQYTVRGDTVEFTCASDLTKVIVIER